VLCVLPVVLPPYWVAMGLRDEAGRAGFHGAHLAALIAAHAGPAAAVAFVVMLKAFDACDWPARDTALAQGAGQFRALWLGAWHAPSDGLAVSAAASFAVAVGLTIPDILTPASHPTLAVLLTAAREAASTYAAPAGLLLAILSLAGVAVAFSLRLLRAWR
jgi:ABC-type Fe3+ transport system permease subunit